MALPPPLASPHDRAGRAPVDRWWVIVTIFWITSMVEGMGVNQIFAFLPEYLREMGVGEADRLHFVGLFSSLIFVVGTPLVPLWGVWADKYSRKAVIVRSALVEAVVFAGVALSREPWQLAASMLLVGLQLGNTGVMLAAHPRRHAAATASARSWRSSARASPLGFAVGPVPRRAHDRRPPPRAAGRLLVSAGARRSGRRAAGAFGSRDVRPEVVPEGRVLDLAFGAVRGVLADRSVRRIFVIFGVSFLANQMSRPYLPCWSSR